MIIDLIGIGFVALAGLGLFWRFVLRGRAERTHRSRALWWRTRLRLHPGRGYATLIELAARWGKLAAVKSGKRVRPDLGFWARLKAPATDYAVRLGRAWYGKRCFARAEDQTLILAPPRTFKTGHLADRIITHPGAVLATSTRADLHELTAGDRERKGPISVWNPLLVGHVPSSFGWNPLDGCENPAIASQRAEAFIGQLLDGDMAFWQRKAIIGLAAFLHAAALLSGSMSDVYAWTNRAGDKMAEEALAGAGQPALPLLAAVQELRLGTKTADSVRATITEALSWITIPSVAEAINPGPGFGLDPVDWAASCGTIYLIAPAGVSSITAPLFRAFTAHVQYEATLAGTRGPFGKLVPPVLMALDELHANPVPLPSWLADGAGKGVQIVAVIHDVGQLEELYGPAGARACWGTTGTKILFGGIQDADILEKVSKLCGEVTIYHDDNPRSVPVAPVDFLRRLPDSRALVLRMNLSPVVVKVRPVWKRLDRRFGRSAPQVRPVLVGGRSLPLPMPDPAETTAPVPGPLRPPSRLRKAAGE
jgi:type IV secretory pathway TraG/TraD family ATPase VirD4